MGAFHEEHQQFNPVDVVDSSKALPNLPNIFQFPSTALRLNQSILKNVSQIEMLFPAIDAVSTHTHSLFLSLLPRPAKMCMLLMLLCAVYALLLLLLLFYRYIVEESK